MGDFERRRLSWSRRLPLASAMRPLTEEEMTTVLEKLFKYVGKKIERVVEHRDEPHCFRLQKNRVYYVREAIMRKATSVARKNLASLGTQIGKFTQNNTFRLTIHSLPLLAEFAQNKIWLKSQAEMSFLYGNNILKSGLGRITEDTERNSGLVVFNMNDVPLGFAASARSTAECRK